MGVLEDGTPYLNMTGLARMCGVARSVVSDIAKDWKTGANTPRNQKLLAIFEDAPESVPEELSFAVEVDGSVHQVLPDFICMAVMEHYAFNEERDVAKANYRKLARASLREVIYARVGYSPHSLPKSLKNFLDRLDLTHDRPPKGYYCVFLESKELIYTLINGGVTFNDDVVFDISIGQRWAAYWKENKLADIFGERVKYLHNYPEHYPQAASNPQRPFAYPEPTLPRFRRWLEDEYIGKHLKVYLKGQVKKGTLLPSMSDLVLDVVEESVQKRLLAKPEKA